MAWKQTFTYDGAKYYEYQGKKKYTLVRIPGRVRDKYLIWNSKGQTISVQYFSKLADAKKFVENL